MANAQEGSGAFRRVLCGVDFSPGATRALERAVALCAALGAELCLVHAYRSVDLVGSAGIGGSTRNLHAHQRVGLEEQLVKLQREHVPAGVRAHHVLQEGIAYDVVPKYAKTHGFDLIVVGSHGRTGFPALLLGSMAERIVRLSPCPVLVVPSREADLQPAKP